MCDPVLESGCGWGLRTRVKRPATSVGSPKSVKMSRVKIVDLVDLKSLLISSNE